MCKKFIAGALIVSFASPLTVAPANAVEVSAEEIAKRKEIIHSCLLNIYINQHKRPQASQEYQTLLAMKPDDAKMHFAYGSFLAQGNEMGGAAAQIKQAIKLDPANAKYNGTLGLMYLKAKKPTQALDYLKQACACPDGKDFQKTYQETYQFVMYQKRLDEQKKKQEEYKKQVKATATEQKKNDDDDW